MSGNEIGGAGGKRYQIRVALDYGTVLNFSGNEETIQVLREGLDTQVCRGSNTFYYGTTDLGEGFMFPYSKVVSIGWTLKWEPPGNPKGRG